MRLFITSILIFITFCIGPSAIAETGNNSGDWGLYFNVVIGALLALSEALSMIPAVKANGIFQVIINLLKALAGKK